MSMEFGSYMVKLYLILLIGCVRLTKCEDNCTVLDVINGVRETNWITTLPSGETYKLFCLQGYGLGGVSIVDVPCVTGQIPKSCRKVRLVATVGTEFKIGSEVKLRCDVSSHDTVTGVRWLKDEKEFRVAGDLQTGTNTYSSDLSFTATSDDSGTYTCEALLDNSSPFQIDRSFDEEYITVLYVTMLPVENPVYVGIDEDFPLECSFLDSAQFSLDIEWTVNSGRIMFYSAENEDDYLVSSLSYKTSYHASRSGVYKCAGTYEKTGKTLQVEGSRTVEIRGIYLHPQGATAGVGGTTKFTCKSVGETEAAVEWSVAGSLQPSSYHIQTYTLSTRSTESVLTYPDHKKQESGVTCNVTYGSETIQSETATLTVMGIGVVADPVDSAFSRYDSFSLTCVVQSEWGFTPSVQWYKGNGLIDRDKYWLQGNDDGSRYTSTLIFNSAELSESGEYRCHAQFAAGATLVVLWSEPANLYIREVTMSPDKSFHESNSQWDTIYLACSYKGDIEPGVGMHSVTWVINGVEVTDQPEFTVSSSQFNANNNWKTKLTMKNLVPDKAGSVECRYECTLGGNISDSTFVYVHRKIDLLSPTTASEAEAEINCQAHTNEEGRVFWLENGKPISHLNDRNFKPQDATTDNFIQTNTLKVLKWDSTNDETKITCKFQFRETGYEYSTATDLIYKGITHASSLYNYYPSGYYTDRLRTCSFGFSYFLPAPTSVSWTKNGQPVTGDYFEVSTSKQTGHWQTLLDITSATGKLEAEQSGNYTCAFTDNDGTIYDRTLKLYFFAISVSPSATQFYDASVLNITCEIVTEGLVTDSVEWTRDDGGSLSTPHFSWTHHNLVSVLSISQVKPENSGTYTCTFGVPGDQELKAEQVIEIRNFVMLTPDTLGAAKGNSVKLSCTIHLFSGTSETIDWYRDDKVVSGATQDWVLPSSDGILKSTLNLENIQTSDMGEYRCGISDSRSHSSTTLYLAGMTVKDAVITSGQSALLECLISSSTAPTEFYWKDSDGVEYREGDGKDNHAVSALESGSGSHATTLTIQGVKEKAVFTCNFMQDGSLIVRPATVQVVSITTSPVHVYTGSTATVSCKIDQAPSKPTATITTDLNINGATPDEGQFVDSSQTISLTLSAVDTNGTFTCSFIFGDDKLTRETTLTVYELNVDDSFLVQGNSPLTIPLTLHPVIAGYSDFIKGLAVESDITENGPGTVTGLTVTYSSVKSAMSLDISFTDGDGNKRTLKTSVHLAEFVRSVVSLSDGIEPATLVCYMETDMSDEALKGMTSYWYSGNNRETASATVNDGVVFAEKVIQVTSETVDQVIPCGFSLEGHDFTDSSILDIIDITAETKVVLPKMGDSINCKIGGSQHIEPQSATWYKEDEQISTESLVSTGWPATLTSTLLNVQSNGSYICTFSFVNYKFSRTIEVEITEAPDPDPVPEMTTKDTVITSGQSALLSCQISGPTTPTDFYWKDSEGVEYREVDGKANHVVSALESGSGSHATTLTIQGVKEKAVFTCNFMQDGGLIEKQATVHVVYISTSPVHVYTGSTATVSCKIDQAPSKPNATITADLNINGVTPDEGQFVDSSQTISLTLSAVDTSGTFTCSFIFGDDKLTEETTLTVCKLTVAESFLVQENTQLTIPLTLQPVVADYSSFVKGLSVESANTASGVGTLSGLTVTYSAVKSAMSLDISFTDGDGNKRTLKTSVFLAVFDRPVVGLSDGVVPPTLTCSMGTGMSDGDLEGISAYWYSGGSKEVATAAVSDGIASTEKVIEVTSSTVDQVISCGFSLDGTDFTGSSILDIVEIIADTKVVLPKVGDSINCKIKGSQYIEPQSATWHKGTEQVSTESLANAGWPGTITSTLQNVQSDGNYRCTFSFGDFKFSRIIEVEISVNPDPDPNPNPNPDPDPNPEPDPDPEPSTPVTPGANSSLPLIMGISVPLFLVLVVVLVLVIYFCTRHLHARRSSYNVKSLSVHASSRESHGRPESLIYHNQPANPVQPAARYQPGNERVMYESDKFDTRWAPASGGRPLPTLVIRENLAATGADSQIEVRNRPPRPNRPSGYNSNLIRARPSSDL